MKKFAWMIPALCLLCGVLLALILPTGEEGGEPSSVVTTASSATGSGEGTRDTVSLPTPGQPQLPTIIVTQPTLPHISWPDQTPPEIPVPSPVEPEQEIR